MLCVQCPCTPSSCASADADRTPIAPWLGNIAMMYHSPWFPRPNGISLQRTYEEIRLLACGKPTTHTQPCIKAVQCLEQVPSHEKRNGTSVAPAELPPRL